MHAFLFPGQGSQQPGMGHDFYEASHAARATLDEAAALNPPDFLETLFGDDAEAVKDTRFAQPALLAVETAIARCLMVERGVQPGVCAGHSLGEIPALVAAGAWRFEDAMRFTQARARLMSECAAETGGGMAAVMGLDARAIEAALPPETQIANYNGPAQTIISGSRDGLAAAAEVLKAAGAKRVLPLPVSGPFHSRFMAPAGEALAEMLEDIPIETPHIPFVSSVTGGYVRESKEIREALASQVTAPVRWTGTMQTLGPGKALEIGPGGVLRGMAKRIDGAREVRAVATLDDADAARDEVLAPPTNAE